MPSTKQLLVAAALAAAGQAAPTFDKRDASFTVEQVANENYKGPAPLAVQKARLHAKYNKNGVPSSIAAAAAAASTGTVSATPADAYDSEYLSPVKIGSQTFSLDFDTGSSDLWVLGSGVKSSGHTTYSPGSTSKKVSGETWEIQYGDGSSASGSVYTDTVNIGGTQVVGQDVEAATKASSAFTSGSGDGLVGLAFDSINTCSPKQCTTFVTNAINNGLPQPLFTAALKYHKAGSYDFGFINSSKYTGSIAYANVDNSQGFWMFTPSGYSIGSGATKSASASVLEGIADTGTTLIYADDSIVSAYYSQVKGATNSEQDGGYIFPCSTTPPDFSLTINGHKATVPGQYINYAPVEEGSSSCFGGIQSDDGIGFAIYGDVFLKSQFVVFNHQTPSLGFATPSS